jgi:NADH dehydrogenase
MNVLVVGATGLVGGMVARQLAERGESVRGLCRPGADTTELDSAGVDLVAGDLADAASLRRAVAGVDVVVATANSARPRLAHDSVRSIEIDGYASLVAAAADAGVGRFVYLSALFADEQSPMEFLRAKAGVERRLASSGMPYTVVAPGPFDEVWPAAVVGGPAAAGLPVTLVRPGTHRHCFVSARDVAAYCMAVLGRADCVGERVAVGGPQNLSWRDVVAVYEAVLGQTIEVSYVDPGEPLPGAPPVFSAMMAGFESGHVEVDMAVTSARFGITPTPLESVVAAMTGS